VGIVWEKLKSITRVLVLSFISSSLCSVNLRASKVLVIPGEILFPCCFALSRLVALTLMVRLGYPSRVCLEPDTTHLLLTSIMLPVSSRCRHHPTLLPDQQRHPAALCHPWCGPPWSPLPPRSLMVMNRCTKFQAPLTAPLRREADSDHLTPRRHRHKTHRPLLPLRGL
jgi:hypothetical protein